MLAIVVAGSILLLNVQGVLVRAQPLTSLISNRQQKPEATWDGLVVNASDFVVDGQVTWEQKDSPILVRGSHMLLISETGTLTIRDGVSVFFERAASGIRNNGRLRVLGRRSLNETGRVVFRPLPLHKGGGGVWLGIQVDAQAAPAEIVASRQGNVGKYQSGSILRWARLEGVSGRAAISCPFGNVPYIMGIEMTNLSTEQVLRVSGLNKTTLIMRDVGLTYLPATFRRVPAIELVGGAQRDRGEFLAKSGRVFIRGLRLHINSSFFGGLHISGLREATVEQSDIRGNGVKFNFVTTVLFKSNDVDLSNRGRSANILTLIRVGRKQKEQTHARFLNNTILSEGRILMYDSFGVEIRGNHFDQGGSLKVEEGNARVVISNNRWTSPSGYMSLFLLDGSAGSLIFADNSVSDCDAFRGIFQLRFRGDVAPQLSVTGNKITDCVADSILSVEGLHWNITRNVFDNVEAPISVDTTQLRLFEGPVTRYKMPENYWGTFQEDIASGRRRSVLDGFAYIFDFRVLVDFVSILVGPSLSFRPMSILFPSELVISNGTLGGLLENGEHILCDRVFSDDSHHRSIILAGDAKLRILGMSRIPVGIAVLEKAELVVDGGDHHMVELGGNVIHNTSSSVTFRKTNFTKTNARGIRISHEGMGDLNLAHVEMRQGRGIVWSRGSGSNAQEKPERLARVTISNCSLECKSGSFLFQGWRDVDITNSKLRSVERHSFLEARDLRGHFHVHQSSLEWEFGRLFQPTVHAIQIEGPSEVSIVDSVIRSRKTSGIGVAACSPRVHIENNRISVPGAAVDIHKRFACPNGYRPAAQIIVVRNNLIYNSIVPNVGASSAAGISVTLLPLLRTVDDDEERMATLIVEQNVLRNVTQQNMIRASIQNVPTDGRTTVRINNNTIEGDCVATARSDGRRALIYLSPWDCPSNTAHTNCTIRYNTIMDRRGGGDAPFRNLAVNFGEFSSAKFVVDAVGTYWGTNAEKTILKRLIARSYNEGRLDPESVFQYRPYRQSSDPRATLIP